MVSSAELLWRGLKSALEADPLAIAGSAAAYGVLFHVTVARTLFVECYLYQFLGILLLGAGTVCAAFQAATGLSVAERLARAALVVATFNGGLFASMAVYRVFFHRLRKFPGPFGAKLSRFYSVYISSKEAMYHKEIAKMHAKYGDFIRTGPREIAIIRKSAIPLIYGPNSECLKGSWYTQVSADHNNNSLHMTRDWNDHKMRRRAWDRGFSVKALNTYEPRIRAKADQLCRQIKDHADAGKPIDVTTWAMLFTFDVMGDVGLGKDFGGLASGVEHPAIHAIHDHMRTLAVMANVPWLLNIVGRIPGAAAGYASFFAFCNNEVTTKQRQWDKDQYPQDVLSWLLKATIERDATAPPTPEALNQDSRAIIIAGSDTTATTLAHALFYLAKHPPVLRKLQAALDAAMPRGAADWSYERVKTVTFIDDVVNETLRLKPALLTGGYRVTPPNGLQVDEVFIPGDTNVFCPIQLSHTDPRWWAEAEAFVPERWGERKEEMGTEGLPFAPFSIGPYSCPGKALAYVTLRVALSRIAMAFDVGFAEGVDADAFDGGALDTFTTTLPPLLLQFEPRK